MVDARRYTHIQSMVLASAVIIAALVAMRLIAVVLAQSGGDSPVKVRGGSMTFRTSSGQFEPVIGSNGFCFVLTKNLGAKVTLDVFQPQPKDHKLDPDKSFTLTNQSQIDFFGRDEKGNANNSDNGIQALITSSCNGAQGISVLIQPEGGNNSRFYENLKNGASQDVGDDPPNDNDKSQSLRFQDLNCAANFTPPKGAGDEDLCENMGLIYVNDAPTPSPKTPGAKHTRCHNGDCLVEFHVH